MKWWMLEQAMRMAPAGDGDTPGGGPAGGGDGDGDGDGGEKTVEELQKELEAERESRKKLEQKRDEILKEHKDIKSKLKSYDGIDPEKARELERQLAENEEMRLLSEGKHDEVVKMRTERLQAEYDSKIENLTGTMKEKEEALEKANGRIQTLLIDNSAVSAFVSEGGEESAIEDVKLRASRDFKIEDGEPIMRDKDGNIVRGKEGPITWAEWVNNLRETAPHLFGASTGANSRGNRGGASKSTGLEAKLEEARKRGDIEEMRRIKKKMRDAVKDD